MTPHYTLVLRYISCFTAVTCCLFTLVLLFRGLVELDNRFERLSACPSPSLPGALDLFTLIQANASRIDFSFLRTLVGISNHNACVYIPAFDAPCHSRMIYDNRDIDRDVC